MLKQFTTDFQELATHRFLRLDEKFWFTTKNLATYDHVLLREIFNLINGNSYTEYYLEEKTDIPYIRIGDLSFKDKIDDSNLIYLDEFCEINEDKKLKKDDLVLATIGTVGKINLARNFEGGTFSNNITVLRLKNKEKHNPYFYEKLFQGNLLQKYICGVESQKAQPNLQTYDLENIKIPLISKSTQDQIMAQIEPIEEKIESLKNKIIPLQKAIDRIFAREFDFNLEEIYKIDNTKEFYIELSRLNYKNNNLRTSYNWNQLERVQNELYKNNKNIESLGMFIKDTKNGWSPECNENEDGQAVLGIDSIKKSGFLSFDNPKYSQQTKNNINDFIIKDGDFFVSRGNTPNLVALASIARVNGDERDYIYPDLMIRIRFDKNSINKEYLAFLFNSIIGRMYFKYSAKGKNQTMVKISSKELYDFELPIPEIVIQDKIVNEIKAELDKQEEMKQKIQIERDKIDEIIEDAVK